ncbi:uncharacterized protein si:ch1073-126c3.2 [Xyrichtys novacula]|uniref:Uncharacterized protein si:ch1073-126c3.2 n=1 Tax=Xyrichtys novacula TaxID=13765 RepID=A0AAV1FYU9_XYRNO|nr:uncharacterized protein si:ch1073-126c3.2 [Xyrichtys novacula]
MALKWTLIWLCSFAAFAFTASDHNETEYQGCNLTPEFFELLPAFLKKTARCGENLSVEETFLLLVYMKNATDALHRQQLKGCQGAEPKQCPDAEVPQNGGLACVTVAHKRYCKPLCNDGYDFAFMRRSRVYDECSEQTGYKWSTQYVGGNRLAVCNEASMQVSGAATAYFPKDCLTTMSSRELPRKVMEHFTSELKNQGIQGEPENPCLVCGGP